MGRLAPCAFVLGFALSAGAIPVPGSNGRLDVSGYLDGLAVIGTEGGQHQRPGFLSLVRMDGKITHNLRAHVEVRGRVGGPFEGGHPGIYDFQHTFQNHTPSLELAEAHLALRMKALDVRLGVQRFAWGRLDGLPPTDVLNPRDLHDPLVTDFEEAKIGVPAAQFMLRLRDVERFDLSQMRATFVYIPIAVPSRLPLTEERWFPSQAVPPNPIVFGRRGTEYLLESTIARRCADPTFETPSDPILAADRRQLCSNYRATFVTAPTRIPLTVRTQNKRAPHAWAEGAIAFRLGGTARGTDWALYHYTGPETGPNVTFETTAALRDTIAIETTNVAVRGVRATSVLRQHTSTIHMTGVDAARVFGGTTVRIEAAMFHDRPYLRAAGSLVTPHAIRRGVGFSDRLFDRIVAYPEAGTASASGPCSRSKPCRTPVRLDDLFPTSDAVEWGIGADYLWNGVFALVQMNQIILLDQMPQLVIGDPDTRFTALIRRRFWQERVEAEVRAVYGIDPQMWFVFPRVSWSVTDDLRLRVGYLAIGGESASLIGQFGRNDEVVVQMRYSF